jgi:signal peptidase II
MHALLLAAAVVVLDQATKALVLSHFQYEGQSLTVLPGFFNLTYVTNRGAAWGMFSDQTAWLTIFAAVMLVALIVFRRQLFGSGVLGRVILGLMLGGIVGNLMDRLRHHGKVIDFLDFHIGEAHWPAFNVADSSICIGVALYVLVSLRTHREAPDAATEASADARND